MNKPNGAVIYRGPSLLDDQPIIAVVTGLTRPSANPKTGPMLQTWILAENVAPHVAIKTGEDASICGACPMRGEWDSQAAHWTQTRQCYVRTHNAPLAVWKAYKRGVYPQPLLLADLTDLTAGQAVRLGAYGDPLAVPLEVWYALTTRASSWTGYTHQWWSIEHARHATMAWSRLLMASVESRLDGLAAAKLGWRYFRVISGRLDYTWLDEVHCPASKESGHKSTCAQCKLCMGTHIGGEVPSIVINQH